MTLFSLRDDRGPSAAVEIAGHRVSAVRVETQAGQPTVVACATEQLPDDVIVPSLTAPNVSNRAAVMRALTRVLQEIDRPRRIGLVIPDPAAKVSLIKFQQVPAKASELDQLIRWQIKKTSPFPIEDAQVSYTPMSRGDDGQEFLVTAARTDIVAEYESLCAEAGAYAGLVDVSTSSVINTVLAAQTTQPSDCLLVNVARDWASLAVLRGGEVVLLRSRAAEGEETLADLVHQTAMYYEDRLNGAGFSRVLICGATSNDAGFPAALHRALGERLNAAVNAVDPTRSLPFTARVTVNPALADTLTPAIGLLVRAQKAAA